ncbi:cyclic nucleotide-gated ion channel 1-like isoform X2 [Rosa rugosa]|uniref:cyclic nucleotide-gated ion channel 1-like isoform X2 n=1 Tax=Rosa rugosa TaxID=74645 RepID=UPI002B40ACD8|nr:cyclic nucleotide-gated ion channel 1-like isoform X2 [Rosa rugosa]
MSKHKVPNYDESIIDLSVTQGIGYDFNCPEALSQHPIRKREPEETQASNKGKRPTVAEVLSVLNPWWNAILLTSCVIAVLFDPLFFYIPYINEKEKCMGIDKQVRTAALVFRSVTDITFLVHIIYQLREAIKFAASKVPRDTNSKNWEWESVSLAQMIKFAKEFSRKLSWRSFLTDVFAIFPMPQLLILGFFFEMGGSNYLERRKILSGFVLIQYVPRIYRIYLSYTAVTHSALWVKGAFNFFLYILASHVLGAFWYFFSIFRETSCWYRSCIDANPRSRCTFYCHDRTPIVTEGFNKTTLGDLCLLKVPYNMMEPPFDFGIFFDALKNDIQGPINFPTKIGFCFWWGLRNLSSFGTSLETSTYLWENSFAILISIIGLLLFLYLIGNVQLYMARAITRAEEVREKIQTKKNDIEKWMENNDLQDDMKEEIMKNIKKKLEEDINADLENLFSVLPWYTKKALKRVLCMSALRKMGEPFDRMVFITEGLMWTYTTATESSHYGKATKPATSPSMDTNFLKKGDSYGHALLQFASSSLAALPTSNENVRCHTRVVAFVLMAKDLKNIVTKCEHLWPFDYNASKDEAADKVAPLGQLPKKCVSTSTTGNRG